MVLVSRSSRTRTGVVLRRTIVEVVLWRQTCKLEILDSVKWN